MKISTTIKLDIERVTDDLGRHTVPMRLTTDHAASSNGIPVLVDEEGVAYGPRDYVPYTSRMADQCVEIAESRYGEVSPEADRLISLFVGRKPWRS